MTKVLRKVPIAEIKIPRGERERVDEKRAREIGASLKNTGQFQTVLLRSDYTLVFGLHRVVGSEYEGLEEIWAWISDELLTEADMGSIRFIENNQRRVMSDKEKALRCRDQAEMMKGATNKEVAESLEITEPQFSDYMSPWGCCQQLQDAFMNGEGGLKLTTAARRVSPEQQLDMLAALRAGATRDQLEAMSRRLRRGTTTDTAPTKRVRLKLGDRSVVIAGPELSIGTAIDILTETLRQAKKARDEGLDVKTFEKVLTAKAKKDQAS